MCDHSRRNFDDGPGKNEQQKSGMIAMVGKGISHPKLPLRQTIRLSYSSYFEHFRDGLRISAFWLAIAAMFDAAMGWMQATWMAHIVEDPRAGPDLTPPVEMTVLDNIGSVVVVFACVSIAVAWHRLLLLEERPGRSGGNLATSALWLYASAAIVICLLAAIPFLALLLATWAFDWAPASSEAIEPQTPFLIAAAIAAYATGAAILLRLCLLLPACAIGDLTLTITGAWRRSRGNSWRLFWGIVACIGPTAVIVGVVFLIMVSIPVPTGFYRVQWAASAAIGICCWLITWPIWIAFLTHAFRFLARPA
ncbi:MAG: hypothetical protein KGK16_11390 [Bradyrhizobium sp.]|nr:hypothetical protein [Bradyrhizobium sp.]